MIYQANGKICRSWGDVALIQDEIKAQISKFSDELWQIAHEIHSFRELKFEEYRSSKLLSEWLAQQGFVVDVGAAGLDTSFVARKVHGENGPTVAILAEYDALPEIGHACGHNLIATMAVGAGVALSEWLNQSCHAGQVMVVGSPGEEGGGGKIPLLEQGIFDTADIAIMLHPAARDEVNPKYLAREGLDFDFYGVPAHAASAPQRGVNALDAVVTFYQMINSLRQRLEPSDRVHGIITHGGDAPNVIPEHTTARILVRSEGADRVSDLLSWVVKAADASASGIGCTFKWKRFVPFYKNVKNNAGLVSLAEEAFSAFGREPTKVPQAHGSTDMGNISHKIPSLHANIGLGEGLVGHTHEFCAAADSVHGRRVMEDGAGILAMIGVRYCTDVAQQSLVGNTR